MGSATHDRMMMSSNRMMWLVLAVAAGAGVAVAAVLMPKAQTRRAGRSAESTRVDEASEDSFPASDPPSFSAPAAAVPGPTS